MVTGVTDGCRWGEEITVVGIADFGASCVAGL